MPAIGIIPVAGLDPAVHASQRQTWVPGSGPGKGTISDISEMSPNA